MKNKTHFLLTIFIIPIIFYSCIPKRQKTAQLYPEVSQEKDIIPSLKEDKEGVILQEIPLAQTQTIKIRENSPKKAKQPELPLIKSELTLIKEDAQSQKLDDIPIIQEPEDKKPEETNPGSEVSKGDEKILNPQKTSNNPEKHFNLTMREANLKNILLSLSKLSEYSFVVDPNVQGYVTIDLKNVTIEEALDSILPPRGYSFKKDSENKIIQISIPRLETRMFTLNYLATKRESSSTLQAKGLGSPKTTQGGDVGAVSKVTTSANADLWDEIEKGVTKLLSNEGKASVNRLASCVVATDYPENLKDIATYIEKVEGTIQRQVLIEATIIEVTLSDEYKKGIDWDATIGRAGDIEKNVRLMSTSPETLFNQIFALGFRWTDINVILQIIDNKGKMNIVSRPRITTLNNQNAVIKVGTEEIYFDIEEEEATYNDRPKINYTANFYTIGLILNVTPQISHSSEITLHIHPIFSEKIAERIVKGIYMDLIFPIVNVRETSSVVKVESGEIVILAGLIMDKNNKKESGIPYLMDFPLIGNLFKYKQDIKEKTELVVILQPKIIYGKEMNELVLDNLENLKGKL